MESLQAFIITANINADFVKLNYIPLNINIICTSSIFILLTLGATYTFLGLVDIRFLPGKKAINCLSKVHPTLNEL